MKNHTSILKWATDYLISSGYVLQHQPEFVQETPWSNVVRFTTSKEAFYLKQTPPLISLEPLIIQLLANDTFSVPTVIAINDELHCFLMKDAGMTLRHYLKTEFQPKLLHQAIQQYASIQRLTENNTTSFLSLGVPDWRLEKLPQLYDQLINQKDVLKAEGMTGAELKILHDLSQSVLAQCELLAEYQIPATIVQPDFNTNNMLFNPISKQMTLIDLGEITIAHPFFSLHNFLLKVTDHFGISEHDPLYLKLQEICLEKWMELITKTDLSEAFALSKKLWSLYFALAHYRLMTSVDLKALKTFYADRPSQLASHLRQYMTSF